MKTNFLFSGSKSNVVGERLALAYYNEIFLKHILRGINLYLKKYTKDYGKEAAKLDWGNDVAILSPAKTLSIMVFENASSRPSKRMRSLDR